MPINQENFIMFTIYYLFKGAVHRRRATKQTPIYHHSPPAPTRLQQPPLPPATTDFFHWTYINHAMDGGAVIVCIGDMFVWSQQTTSFHHPPIIPTKVDCYM